MTFTPNPGQLTHSSKGNSAEAPNGRAQWGHAGSRVPKKLGARQRAPSIPLQNKCGDRDQLGNADIGKVTQAWGLARGPWSPVSGAGSGQRRASRVPLLVLKAQPSQAASEAWAVTLVESGSQHPQGEERQANNGRRSGGWAFN